MLEGASLILDFFSHESTRQGHSTRSEGVHEIVVPDSVDRENQNSRFASNFTQRTSQLAITVRGGNRQQLHDGSAVQNGTSA